MTARQYDVLDIENVAIRIETVVATLQMAIERLPNDGRVGDVPEVLCLCMNHLSDQKQELYLIFEGLKPPLKAVEE